jgi:hypothetical protein
MLERMGGSELREFVKLLAGVQLEKSAKKILEVLG